MTEDVKRNLEPQTVIKKAVYDLDSIVQMANNNSFRPKLSHLQATQALVVSKNSPLDPIELPISSVSPTFGSQLGRVSGESPTFHSTSDRNRFNIHKFVYSPTLLSAITHSHTFPVNSPSEDNYKFPYNSKPTTIITTNITPTTTNTTNITPTYSPLHLTTTVATNTTNCNISSSISSHLSYSGKCQSTYSNLLSNNNEDSLKSVRKTSLQNYDLNT